MMTSPTAAPGDFRGWKAAFLSNDVVRLALVPDIGGRVMAYDLGGTPLLYINSDLAGKLFTPEENQGDGSLGAWKNYGGDKTWPAPQGWDTDEQWHGPPDNVLDSGRYTLDALEATDGEATARMTSPPDARTGLQITRQFALRPGSSRVSVDLTFRNIAQRTVRWSIWDVVQLNAERRQADGTRGPDRRRIITTPANEHSIFPRGFRVLFGADDNPQWHVRDDGLFEASYQYHIGKVAIDSPGNWIAFSSMDEDSAFVLSFETEPGAYYPDGGASVEIWTVGTGQVGNLHYEDSGIYHMEAEVLGPIYALAPGDQASFPLEWGACRCEGVIIDVPPAGPIVEELTARREPGRQLRLHASGGCFDLGELVLRWLTDDDELLGEISFGPAGPLNPVRIDHVCVPPEGAVWAEIVNTLPNGEQLFWSTAAISQEGN
jgi:hypothetical protein